MRLARVGHETVKGHILFENYHGEVRKVEQVPVQEVSGMPGDNLQFVDVRRSAEYAAGHAANTINLPLDKLPKAVEQLDPEKPTYVICQGGYRSSLGTSILENAGFKEIYNVTGGTAAWIGAGLATEASGSTCSATQQSS